MMFPNPDLYKQIEEQQTQDYIRQAETRRLLREAGLDQRGWLSQQVCRLLSWVGRLLVAVGRRLEALEGASEAAGQMQGAGEVPSRM